MDADGVRQVGDGLWGEELSGLSGVWLYFFDGELGHSLLFRFQCRLAQQGAQPTAQAGVTGSFCHVYLALLVFHVKQSRVLFQYLFRQFLIGFCSSGELVIGQRRFPVAGGFTEPDVSGDDGGVHLTRKMMLDFFCHLDR